MASVDEPEDGLTGAGATGVQSQPAFVTLEPPVLTIGGGGTDTALTALPSDEIGGDDDDDIGLTDTDTVTVPVVQSASAPTADEAETPTADPIEAFAATEDMVGRLLAKRFGADMKLPDADTDTDADAFSFNALDDEAAPTATTEQAALDPFLDTINPAWMTDGDLAAFVAPDLAILSGIVDAPLSDADVQTPLPDGATQAPVPEFTPDGWVV